MTETSYATQQVEDLTGEGRPASVRTTEHDVVETRAQQVQGCRFKSTDPDQALGLEPAPVGTAKRGGQAVVSPN